ncbi:hypothetical protein GOV04_01840 [Candidatus Woesearchaeota archaeon]|nr:hypothetical protein [Candidatus Woesearchaeota archaeon]
MDIEAQKAKLLDEEIKDRKESVLERKALARQKMWGGIKVFTNQNKHHFIPVLILLALIIVLFYVFPIAPFALQYFEAETISDIPRAGVAKIIQSIEQVTQTTQSIYDEQLARATGAYYAGEVEKNQQEPLGVYIENLQAADPKVTEDEDIYVWGTLRAKTLNNEKPIEISLTCYGKDSTGANKVEGTAQPSEFEVYSYEEADIQCHFGPNALKFGSKTISFEASFNFETDAYLKTYFMSLERQRSMQRDRIDPFEEYGISDRDPKAIFTNGPIMLAMDTANPLIGVGEGTVSPLLGVTVEKRWDGMVKNLNELTVSLPKPLSFTAQCRLFDAGSNEEEYNTYPLSADSLNGAKDIVSFKTYKCPFNIPSEILGESPLTIKYFKAHAEYDYLLKKTTILDISRGLCNSICATDSCDVCPNYCARSGAPQKGYSCGGYP